MNIKIVITNTNYNYSQCRSRCGAVNMGDLYILYILNIYIEREGEDTLYISYNSVLLSETTSYITLSDVELSDDERSGW